MFILCRNLNCPGDGWSLDSTRKNSSTLLVSGYCVLLWLNSMHNAQLHMYGIIYMVCTLRIFHKLSDTFFVWRGVESSVLSENWLVECTAGFDPIANLPQFCWDVKSQKFFRQKAKIFSWLLLINSVFFSDLRFLVP